MDFLQHLHSQATSGNIKAQRVLALAYDQGWGVTQDLSKAFLYYKMAADSGVADAAAEVGRRYHSGMGTAADPVQSFNYLKAATEAGNLVSHFFLSMLYAQGHGTAQDLTKAKECIQILVDRQYPQAIDLKDLLDLI